MKQLCRFGVFAVLLAASLLCLAHPPAAWPALAPVEGEGPVLVLDAGHGGEDGGAVSLTGVPESGINLAITERMDLLLSFCGAPPVLLRTEDVSLHDGDADTLREKKASDLRNRAQAVEQVENAVLLSVHQNTFTDKKYHGAQVFYAPTEGSRELAEAVQEALRTGLDPDNRRQAKPIPDSVYLLNHVTCPAVLVECGFLSNPEEEVLLRSDSYQTKVAAVLAGAWLRAS